MCIFSDRVQDVGSTQIFARLRSDVLTSQYLVYSMSVRTDRELAMILPLPVSVHAEDAVKFIALDGYPEFFDDMAEGFAEEEEFDLSEDYEPIPYLEVHQVGDFVASVVPTLGDFDRLDARFRLPSSTWDRLPQYRDWAFAVFQLKQPGDHQAQRIHPMALRFPTRFPEALYFPTMHVHDGQVNEQARFDHILYFQGATFRNYADYDGASEIDAERFIDVAKAKGIVQPDALCFRCTVRGTLPNRDSFVTQEAGNHGPFA